MELTKMEVALIGIIVTLCGYIIYHRLTLKREKLSRLAVASNNFRNSILTSIAHIPKSDEYWDNKILQKFPIIVKEFGLAVEQFKVFLSKSDKEQFEKEWLSLRKHIENIIPKSLSTAEVMYGGGTVVAKKTREKFHERVKNLLSYANET